MSLLEQIVEVKRRESEALSYVDIPPHEPHPSFLQALKRKPGEPVRVIAECKKASPSQGLICENYQVREIAKQYASLGASAVSVLTDREFFSGDISHLRLAAASGLPVLRKDFIISPNQIFEARARGAHAILLIVRILHPIMLRDFIQIASSLDLDVLVEIHKAEEMETALKAGATIIGINHRDLDTLEINMNLTPDLAPVIRKENPDSIIIAESGVESKEGRMFVEPYVDGILIGTALMRSSNLKLTWESIFT